MTGRIKLLGAIAPWMLAAGAADAQTEQQGASLEEIVVTAQKRAENLQSVPISIAAVTADTLDRAGAATLDAVQRLTPGMNMSTVGSGFVSYTYIRGGGTNVIDAGSDPSVAFFVDEVYQAGTTGLQSDLLDIERIEVLKGPQGTLFGRNAAAGAISIITRRPASKFGAYVNTEYGNYGSVAVRGGVTGPLTDDGVWRYRLAAGHRSRDAFTDNPGGLDPGFIDNYSLRGQLERVTDDFDLRLSGDYFTSDNGMTNQFLTTTTGAGFLTPAAAANLPTDQSMFRRYYSFNDGFERQDTGGVTARMEWQTGLGTVTSITGFRTLNFRRAQDQDGSAGAGHELLTQEKVESLSQELRLAGDSGRWNWLGGLYFYDATTDRVDVQDAGADFPTAAFQNTAGRYHQHIDTRSVALFGQATVAFTDRLGLTVGGRYSMDRKQSQVQNDPLGPAGEFTAGLDPDWSSFDPSAVLEYQATPDLMVYGSFRQGYKSGGFQTFASTVALASTPFSPEQVRAYELGLRSEWLDRRVQFNATLFQVDIDDQQIQRIPTAGIAIIDNAGKTQARGVDLSLVGIVSDNLRIDVNSTLQRARFEEYLSAGNSFKDNHQLRSPDTAVAVGIEYSQPVGGLGEIIVRGDYSYQSKIFFDGANTSAPHAFQPGYGLFNARVILARSDGWEFALWGKNLADERYFRNIAVVAVSGLGVPGDPRTFGVSVNWRMD